LSAVLCALVVVGSAASRPLANGGAAPPDPAGDSGNAPDITTISVRNDNAGKLTWEIGIGNRSSWTGNDFVQIPIDADRRFSTGPDGGFEHTIQADADGGVTTLFGWDGTDYFDARSKTATSSFANGVLTISIDFRELGTDRPRFYLYSDTSPTDADNQWDDAPPSPDAFIYPVLVPVLLDKFAPPKSVRAGKSLAASITVWTDDEKSPKISCKAKAGGKAVAGKSSWAYLKVLSPEEDLAEAAHKGLAGCRFAVSKSLRGKALSVTVTLTKEGVALKKTFVAKIR
jgi:hypothetical protein